MTKPEIDTQNCHKEWHGTGNIWAMFSYKIMPQFGHWLNYPHSLLQSNLTKSLRSPPPVVYYVIYEWPPKYISALVVNNTL